MIKRRVHFHGPLAALCPDPVEVFAETVAEAIDCVTRQLASFRPTIHGKKRIAVVGCDSVEQLIAPSDQEDIHCVPQFCGGKKGGLFQIVLGAVLIAASFALPGSVAALSFGLKGFTLGGFLFSAGASMLLGGLGSLLAPKPALDNPNSGQDPDPSKYLGAPKNTVAIGTRIPVGYGLYKVFGHILSFDIDAKDVA